jgi:hypothetical protein
MPEKPWRKSEAEEGKGGRGWVNTIVLAALALAVAVVTLVVLVPREQWANLWRNLPDRWETLRALLRGEEVRQTEPEPLVSPTSPPAELLVTTPPPGGP